MERNLLIKKIRKLAESIVLPPIREDVLFDIERIADEINANIKFILEKIPDAKINVEGQIVVKLKEILRSEKITRIVYERYKKLVGEENCYTYMEFMRQVNNAREGYTASPFYYFLVAENRGLKPGEKIRIENQNKFYVISRINREGRVVISGLNRKRIKPDSCSLFKEQSEV